MAEKNIVQHVPIKITTLLTAAVLTPPGADTQKILDGLLPAIIKALSEIRWVAKVDAVGVEEIVPEMKSTIPH